MKVLCSEFNPDYGRYRYPYVVWALPEAGETPADLYGAGFHPASPELDRFALCRHLRVALAAFRVSSENRRVLRKGTGLQIEVITRSAFSYDREVRAGWLAFAADRFGAGVMTGERLDGLMRGRVVTHLMVCRDQAVGGKAVGHVLLHLEPTRMAHYYYAFYDRDHSNRNLGLFLMTSAVLHFQEAGFDYLYLGTCYSERALYKTQFVGIEFFNGLNWSSRLAELKFLVRREAGLKHLLEEPEFLESWGGLETLRQRQDAGWSIRPGL